MQPMLIFDKSFLESLNPDEAVWLDNFFVSSITPLFFVETLADLEKEVRRGRTPEQVVGNLAYKTPDMNSHVNPNHASLLLSELLGAREITMDARIMRTGGGVVQLNNRQGMVYTMSQEEEALNRWQKGEFLDLERQIAKVWRKNVTGVDHTGSYALFNKLYGSFRKPKSLEDAKQIADTLVDLFQEEISLRFGMSLLNIPLGTQAEVVQRWSGGGKPSIGKFAPYFRYVYSVELFFYLALGADLISRVRPANKADNKVDVAYLYYLPFCKVFASNDNLHERVVPLFLREDQTFVRGQLLKADLKRLDEYFDAVSQDVKAKGLHAFASYPPLDDSFLVTRLWDKHVPEWRKEKAEEKELTPELKKALMDLVHKISRDSELVEVSEPPRIQDLQYIHMSRQIFRRKGKWERVPPDAK
jgi:hypothetical protein